MTEFEHDISERTFMSALLKHTGIALAMLIPLAAYTSLAHASSGVQPRYSNDNASAGVSIAGSDTVAESPVVSEPTAIDSVDLEKYAGRWYEIARLPMRFQKDCASDVTATYNVLKNSLGEIKSVQVINECREDDGSLMQAKGLAKPANSSNSKLKVSFLPSWVRWVPVGKADYWVLELDDDYQNALVGTPDNKYLWLLSRTPDMSTSTYNRYVESAQRQGYNTNKLKMTVHNP